MKENQQQPELRTLRDYGFTGCSHDDGSVAFDRGVPHCPYCGAKRVGSEFIGGSVDYRIDFAVHEARKRDPQSCFYEHTDKGSKI